MDLVEPLRVPSGVVEEINAQLGETSQPAAVISRFESDDYDKEFETCHKWSNMNMQGNTENFLKKREIIFRIILGHPYEVDDSLMEPILYYIPLIKMGELGYLRLEKDANEQWTLSMGELLNSNTLEVKCYFTRNEVVEMDYRYMTFAQILKK